MTQAPTAAILIIGNEILAGSTQDINTNYAAKKLFARGIKLCEVRMVRDEEDAIIRGLNALRAEYSYVFTTGGIGPTHDDITAESVSKAFGVPCEIHPEARQLMAEKYAARGVEMNEGRLRMARMPRGATLIHCAETIAPGFQIGNVYVMAGVPKIMQAQCDAVIPTLAGGAPLLSRTVQCNLKEGDIALRLEEIQKQFPDIDIGSYPHMGQTPSLSLVLRGTDDGRLLDAQKIIADMVRAQGEEPTLLAA